jgi:Asp-tRNA(Asn)/Glu-tRNA(Gln) amidotransferase A subunit family amidase
MMLPYYEWPSLEKIAREVQSGACTARSQVELALSLAQRETLDSSVSPTFISLDAEGALAMADALDAKIKRGELCGDLCGIPLAVKDNIDYLGHVTTAGSPKAYSKKAIKTASVLQSLIDRGAIPIGKTNMNEWAVGLTGENIHYGNVKNPHLAGCLSGGSSSGSARAVAMGIVPMALGSDTGGSIRMPAAWCGIVGLRPSSDSFALDGVVPRSRSLDVVGPLVKNVQDCDYFLANSFCPKSEPYLAKGEVTPIRIAWDPRLLDGLDSAVRDSFLQFIQSIQRNPKVFLVEQSWPDLSEATDCAFTILQLEFLEDFRLMCGNETLYADRLGAPVFNEMRQAALLEPQELSKALAKLSVFRSTMAQFVEEVDMLALPLTPCGPVEEARLPDAAKPLRKLSLPMGASGLPILSMPLISAKEAQGLSEPSLSGVQLVGQAFQEHKLIYMVKTYLDAPS